LDARYPSIDVEKTGIKIKQKVTEAGYTPQMLQEYFGFTSPRSVYRWFQGKTLPGIDSIYALSLLLETTINDLLVQREDRTEGKETEEVEQENYETFLWSTTHPLKGMGL